MKKKAQKFSFIMMIVFCLTGIAMTIVSAVTVGTGFGMLSGMSSLGVANPLAKYVFPVILAGLVITFSVTAVWWAVLEHFRNVEKTLDGLYRAKTGKDELPDKEYSYIPAPIEDMMNKPPMPIQPQYQQPYQPYPQQPQYGQPQVQPAPPVQPPVPPVQPPVQPEPVAPVMPEPSAMPEDTAPEEQPVLPEQPTGEWFCPVCGAPNQVDSNFCSSCGHKKD